MRTRLQRIFALPGRIFESMGISYLSMDFMRFLRMHSFYNIAINLSGVFISTFLLKAGSGFGVVGLYYLTAYLCEAAGNALMPRFGTVFAQASSSRFGILLYLSSYILLLVFREKVLLFFPLVAVMGALGAALYWFPYHYYMITYTTPRNRQFGISLLGMVGNLIVLITPLLSGLLTSKLEGYAGYIVIFSLSSVAFLTSVFISRKLPSAPSVRPRNAMGRFLRQEFKKPVVYSVSIAHFCYGLRDGVFLYFMNILIFDMISSELALGLNITFRSCLVIVSFALMAKYLTLKRRIRLNFAALFLSLGLSLTLMGFPVPAVLLVVCVLDAVTAAFTHNSLQLATYELADYITANTEHHRELCIALRNVSLNLGRAVGVFMLIALSSLFTEVQIWPLVLLNTLALPTAFTLRRVIKNHG